MNKTAARREIFTLTTFEELKALADPVRLRLLQAFAEEPLTTKQAASQLGEHPTKLYHHVQQLESLGLIELVKTKPKRGTVEKYYSSVARHFRVDDKLLLGQPSAQEVGTLQGVMDSLLESTRTQFRASLAAGLLTPPELQREGTIAQTTVRASRQEIRRLEKKLARWLAEVDRTNKEQGEAVYSVTVCFFPLAQPEKPKRNKR